MFKVHVFILKDHSAKGTGNYNNKTKFMIMTRNVSKIPYWECTLFPLKSASNYRCPLRSATRLGLPSAMSATSFFFKESFMANLSFQIFQLTEGFGV